ncbi:P-loop containing nucleoside triphosphate hydrolase protein [Obelidium mucronatum]|nr:P-loop containing nucleoside triphosphate hydrolase protein [Obelidium mucronatum]
MASVVAPAPLVKQTVSSILVALRIRPLTTKESKESTSAIVKPLNKTCLSVTDLSDAQDVLRQDRPREKTYEFDSVFSETASQVNVFEGTTKELVDFVLQGFNTTVFAYGATGAGKTYTMLGTHEHPGVMPQTLDHLFSQIAKASRVQTTAGASSNNSSGLTQSYKVSLSYLEIYNENIRDLLSGRPDYLELWEDRIRGSVVSGIERVEAKTAGDVLEWLEKGNLNRTQEATGANEASSRSHAVLQVFVAHRTCNKKGQYTEQNGKLSMIDLAGSERAADTKNRGMRMIEGASINRSLLALGNCINALTEEGNNGKYVNYRDSKLTRLLKDSLGGNCKTVMIANISPTAANFEETLNTLKYASRARAIKNKVVQQVPVPIPKPISLMSLASKSKSNSVNMHQSLADGTSLSKSHKSNVFQRLSDPNLAKHNVQARYLGTANGGGGGGIGATSKPSTGVNSMLSELENCLLECFQERKSLQKSMNSLDVRIASVTDKIAAERKRTREKSGGASEKIAKYERKAVKLRALKKSLFKKSGDADDKVKSINQTFPRSLDQPSQKYLESRIKSHFIEMENLKLEGAQSILASKLKKQELEYAAFMSQLSLLEAITSVQRDILDQKHVPIPEKLQEYYTKLKSASTKPTSSGSDSSDSSSGSILDDHHANGSSDLSSDENTKQSRSNSRQLKISDSEPKPAKSGLLFPRIGLMKTSNVNRQNSTVSESDTAIAEASLKLPDVHSTKHTAKSSTDTLTNNSHDTIATNDASSSTRHKSGTLLKPEPQQQHHTVRFLTPTNVAAPHPTVPAIKTTTNEKQPPPPSLPPRSPHTDELYDSSVDDSEFSTTESPSAPLRTRPRQSKQQISKSLPMNATPQPSLPASQIAGSTPSLIAKLKHESQAKTIKEARQEIQHQIREARAERQRARQSQELDARLSGGRFGKEPIIKAAVTGGTAKSNMMTRRKSNPELERPSSEASRKVKVVAGKGIIS